MNPAVDLTVRQLCDLTIELRRVKPTSARARQIRALLMNASFVLDDHGTLDLLMWGGIDQPKPAREVRNVIAFPLETTRRSG